MTDTPQYSESSDTRTTETTAKAKFRKALDTALAQYRETMGEDFPIVPRLQVINDSDFGALAEMDGDEFVIRASTGTVAATANLWHATLADRDVQNGAFAPPDATAEDLTHLSLVWLMLHEMHHYQMEHFQFLGRAHLSESFGANAFAVATRAAPPNPIIAELDKDDIPKVEPSLEMQADHDALEMLLDAYSSEGWPELRVRVAAVSAMMMLIEKADAKARDVDTPPSHPKAATRIFQLLGHVMHMPMIRPMLAAQHPELDIDPTPPSMAEVDAFKNEVFKPSFYNAATLARVANSDVIREDLGEPEDFFKDVEIALMKDPSQFNALNTTGANQWAEFVTLNAKLLDMMGLE